MSAPGDLLLLMQLSDSAFPSGAFAFSNGLETLVREGRLEDEHELETLLHAQILPRWFAFDRVFIAQAHGAGGDPQRLAALDADCDVRNTTSTLRAASLRIGRGTLTSHARRGTPGAAAWLDGIASGIRSGHAPVVQGAMGRAAGLGLAETEAGALHGLLSAFVSSAVRLGRLGALSAQPILLRATERAGPELETPSADIPTAFAPLLEISASRADASAARLFAN